MTSRSTPLRASHHHPSSGGGSPSYEWTCNGCGVQFVSRWATCTSCGTAGARRGAEITNKTLGDDNDLFK